MSYKGNLITLCITAVMGVIFSIVGLTIGLLGIEAGISLCIVAVGCLLIAWHSWKEVCR